MRFMEVVLMLLYLKKLIISILKVVYEDKVNVIIKLYGNFKWR